MLRIPFLQTDVPELTPPQKNLLELTKVRADFERCKETPEIIINRLLELFSMNVAQLEGKSDYTEALKEIESCMKDFVSLLIVRSVFQWRNFVDCMFVQTGSTQRLLLAKHMREFIEVYLRDHYHEAQEIMEFYAMRANRMGHKECWLELINYIKKYLHLLRPEKVLLNMIREFQKEDDLHPLLQSVINLYSRTHANSSAGAVKYKFCQHYFSYLPFIRDQAISPGVSMEDKLFNMVLFLLMTTQQKYAIDRFELVSEARWNLPANVKLIKELLTEHAQRLPAGQWYLKLVQQVEQQNSHVVVDPVNYLLEKIIGEDKSIRESVEQDILRYHELQDMDREEAFDKIRRLHAIFPAVVELSRQHQLDEAKDVAGQKQLVFSLKITTQDGVPVQMEGEIGECKFPGKGKGTFQLRLFGRSLERVAQAQPSVCDLETQSCARS